MRQFKRSVSIAGRSASSGLLALLLGVAGAAVGCGGGSKEDFSKPLALPKPTPAAESSDEAAPVAKPAPKSDGETTPAADSEAKPQPDSAAPTETPQAATTPGDKPEGAPKPASQPQPTAPAQVAKTSSKDPAKPDTKSAEPTELQPLTAEELEWLSARPRQSTSLDGEVVLTALNARQLNLHDIRLRTLDRVFFGKNESVTASAIGPARKWVVAALESGTLRLWGTSKAQTGLDRFAREAQKEAEATIAGEPSEQGVVRVIAVQPRGEWFVTGGDDGSLQVWSVTPDAPTKLKKLKRFDAHKGAVTALAASADGQKIVSGGQDRRVQLWDVATWTSSQTWTDAKAAISDVGISADGKVIAASSFDTYAYWWSTEPKDAAKQPAGETSEKPVVKASPKAQQEAKPANRLDHPDLVLAISVSADGQQVLTGCKDKQPRVWDLATGKNVQRYESAKEGVVEVRYVADGKRVLIRDRNGAIRNKPLGAVVAAVADDEDVATPVQTAGGEWQFTTPPELFSVPPATTSTVGPASGTLNQLASALRTAPSTAERAAIRDAYFTPPPSEPLKEGETPVIVAWKPAANSSERTERPQLIGSVATQFDFQAKQEDGPRTVATELKLQLSADGELLSVLKRPATHPGGIASREAPMTISQAWVWDVASQAPLRHWDDLATAPETLQFIASRNEFVAPKTAHVFRISTGRTADLSETSTDKVVSVTHSPDGQRIAVASTGSKQATNKVLRLLDANTLDELQAYEAFESVCTAVAFTPDGASLIAAIRERQQHRLLMLDAATFEVQTSLEEHVHAQPWLWSTDRETQVDRGVTSLVFSGDGRMLISNGTYAPGDFRLTLWQRKGSKWVRETASSVKASQPIVDESHQALPFWFVGGKTNQVAAITSKGLRIIDTSNSRLLRSVELRDGQQHRGPYTWSGDGCWLVQGDNLGNVAVWNLRTEKEPGFFTAQRGPVKALALSHNGQFLATLGEENQLHLWHLAGWTPKNRVTLKPKSASKPASTD